MSTQHTPGPWIWGPNARLYADASLPECQRVMNVQIGKTTALCWDIKDARLIAAAPELLACLCEMLGAAEMDCMDDKSNVWRNLMSNAQVAIAKATGAA